MRIDELGEAMRTMTWERPRLMDDDTRLASTGFKWASLFPGAVPVSASAAGYGGQRYMAYWCWIIAGRSMFSAFEFSINEADVKACAAEYERRSYYAREALIDHVRDLLKPAAVEDGGRLPAPKESANAQVS